MGDRRFTCPEQVRRALDVLEDDIVGATGSHETGPEPQGDWVPEVPGASEPQD